MTRDRIDGYIRTTVLLSALVVSSVASVLVPSPYRQTASVVDPLLERIPAASPRSERGREARVTLHLPGLAHSSTSQYQHVN